VVRTKKRSKAPFLFGLIFILLIASIGTFIYLSMRPVASSDQAVDFVVEEGIGTAGIADQLQEKGLIRSALLYKVYLRIENEGSSFQVGNHALMPGADYGSITAALNEKPNTKENSSDPNASVKVTIPEGLTIKQIAERFNKAGNWDAKSIRQLSREPQKFSEDLPAPIPDSQDLQYALEGYLFPDTYEFVANTSEENIVRRLVQETTRKLQSIPNFDQLLKERGLSVHELLTVASLVEREAVVDSERPLIAGVIYNRLDDSMRLQIDATVQYALGEQKERLLYSDLKIDSPYNTYRNEGLPPGPIAAPSLKSIEAALQPEASDYLFYVTKKDGSGEHLFAKTFAEHEKNIEKSKKEN